MLFETEFLRATLRLATPLLLASLGGTFMYHAAVPNVAKEGMMLIGAMVSFVISLSSGSPLIGLAAAILAACGFGVVYALFVLAWRANVYAVGFTLNLLIAGLIAYVLRTFLGEESTLVSPSLPELPQVSLSLLSVVPFLDKVLNDHSVLIPVSFVLVIVVGMIVYQTPFGYWLRAAGMNPTALEAAGKRSNRVIFVSFMLSASFCGLAGAHLSIGYLNLFSLNMVAGKGFIALAIVFLARGRPLLVLLASLTFGAAEAAAPRVPIEMLPPQFSLMFPYLATLVIVTIVEARRGGRIIV